jgi:folate-dependent phosphoribosylglycinamide formyltransferase PurN
MNKITLITGSHPRHLYLAGMIIRNFTVRLHVVMKREAMNTVLDKNSLLYKHFYDRDVAEKLYFLQDSKDYPFAQNTVELDYDKLNSIETIDLIKFSDSDLILVYGVGILKNEFLKEFDYPILNIHGGLSPYYKGAATMFWPFYFLEPNFVGVTLHKIVKGIDAGDILHQTVPKLSKEDKIHDVACKAVIAFTSDLEKILENKIDKNSKFVPQKKTGKLFLISDFKEQHIRSIYELYNNDIVKMFLSGEFGSRKPHLVDYFNNN